MRDWHLRVFLHPIWSRWTEFRYTPWVVPWKLEAFDAKFWGGRKAEVFGVAMDEYVAAMSDGLQALAPAPPDRVRAWPMSKLDTPPPGPLPSEPHTTPYLSRRPP